MDSSIDLGQRYRQWLEDMRGFDSESTADFDSDGHSQITRVEIADICRMIAENLQSLSPGRPCVNMIPIDWIGELQIVALKCGVDPAPLIRIRDVLLQLEIGAVFTVPGHWRELADSVRLTLDSIQAGLHSEKTRPKETAV